MAPPSRHLLSLLCALFLIKEQASPSLPSAAAEPDEGKGMAQNLRVANIWDSVKEAKHSFRSTFLPMGRTLVREGYEFRSSEYLKASWDLVRVRKQLFEAHSRHVEGLVAKTQQEPQQGGGKAGALPDAAALMDMAGLASYSGMYFVFIGLGSPPQVVSVTFDTGSTLLWVSCDCISCPTDSILVKLNPYRPESSNTSTRVACKSRECAAMSFESPASINPEPQCAQGNCPFKLTFLDLNTAEGDIINDVVTLPSMVGGNVVGGLSSFGCASNLTGSIAGKRWTVDGLMGGGATKDSIIGQLASDGVLPFAMSFCLDSVNATGSHLVLGRGPAPRTMTKIPLILNRLELADAGQRSSFNLPYYYVNLLELRVGSVAITSSRGMNVYDSSTGSGGVILDSGSTYTVLPEEPYHDILTELTRATGYMFQEQIDGRSCIVGSVDISKFPRILMVFGSTVAWPVPPTSYMLPPAPSFENPEQSVTCIGMTYFTVDVGIPSIIGETFMTDYFVQIDVEKKFVGFAPLNCTTGNYFTATTPSPAPASNAGVNKLPYSAPAPREPPLPFTALYQLPPTPKTLLDERYNPPPSSAGKWLTVLGWWFALGTSVIIATVLMSA